MTPLQLLATSLLLGFFVLLAGCYGVLYCLGRLGTSVTMLRGSYIAYVLQALVAVAIAASTPLEFWWKVLVVASCIAYLPIPPVTWRYLENLHEVKEHHP
jgi:hypothetical protein